MNKYKTTYESPDHYGDVRGCSIDQSGHRMEISRLGVFVKDLKGVVLCYVPNHRLVSAEKIMPECDLGSNKF